MNLKEMEATVLEERKVAISKECEAEGADLDALLEEVRAINEELEARKAEEAKKEELRNLVATEEVGTTVEEVEFKEERKDEVNPMEIRNSKEYIDAFAEYIKTEDPSECRALLTENGSGSVAVPELVADIVRHAWEQEEIMSLVTKRFVKGNYKVTFEISGTDATVHTEGANLAEETLYLGTIEMIPKNIKKWISISDEVYALRGEEFLRYIYEELAHKVAKKMADELIAKIDACGTTSTATCVGVPVVTASSIALGTVASAMSKLSGEASKPVIMMNRLTWGAFKAAQYAASYPVDPFEGLDIKYNDSITAYSAASTGDTYAIVGDLGYGALANFPEGDNIIFKFDDISLAEKDLIKVTAREYVGLGVVAPNAFVKIQK